MAGPRRAAWNRSLCHSYEFLLVGLTGVRTTVTAKGPVLGSFEGRPPRGQTLCLPAGRWFTPGSLCVS